MSEVRCPSCGSTYLRPSMQLSPFERLAEMLGVVYLRCRDCDQRFRSGLLLDFRSWQYAKCPRCYRTTLTTWKREKYRISRVTKLLLGMGGKPYRCVACRCNFVSFRKLKPADNSTEAEYLRSTT